VTIPWVPSTRADMAWTALAPAERAALAQGGSRQPVNSTRPTLRGPVDVGVESRLRWRDGPGGGGSQDVGRGLIGCGVRVAGCWHG
jgi:hypothetical protein